MKKLTWKQAKNEIKNGTILLEFTTSWCGDCKMMKPVVDNAKNEILKSNKNVKFIEVDAEEANLYNSDETDWEVLKVPSFFYIKDGKRKHIGYEYLPLEKLTENF